MIGSLIIVAVLALIGVLLAPLWRNDEATPLLRSGLEIGLAPGRALEAGGAEPGSVAAATVAGGGGGTLGRGSTAKAGSVPTVGISAALVVSGPAPTAGGVPETAPGPSSGAAPAQPAPVAAPAPEAAPAPVPVAAPAPAASEPVVADLPSETGRPGGSGESTPPRTAGGGPGVSAGSFEFQDGGEYELLFEFMAEPTAYLEAGVENLLLRFGGDEGEPPLLGLQLWQLGGDQWYSAVTHGLWASGVAAGGERFLAPASDGVWHRLVVDFAASNRGKGDYTVFLDGALIDARSAVSLIAPEGATGTVELGLFREGQRLEGASGLRVAGAGIGESSPSSLP